MKLTDKVSIVVTTKNEAKNIGLCLESIVCQSWKNIELIVIDNNSSDCTLEIARKYTKLVYQCGPERSAQRNYGFNVIASGNFGLYIDADMILSPSLVEACLKKIKAEKNCVALYLHEIILGSSYFCKVRRFERQFYTASSIDGARFFNLKTFKIFGGFDEQLFKYGSGEDWDLDKNLKKHGEIELLSDNYHTPITIDWNLKSSIEKLGVNVCTHYCGIYHNESNFKLLSYLKKKHYYGSGFDDYIKKWGKEDPDIKKQFGIYYRYLGVFIENGKWKKFFTRIDLAIGLFLLRVLVGVLYLLRKRSK